MSALEQTTLDLLQGLAADRRFRASMSTLSYDVIQRLGEWLEENRDVLRRHSTGASDQGDYVFALLMGWLIGLGEPGLDVPRLLRAVEIGLQASQQIAREITPKRPH